MTHSFQIGVHNSIIHPLIKCVHISILTPIAPVNKDNKNWTNFDKYCNNNNEQYKKILTDPLNLVALTQDGKVIAIHNNPMGLGIIPDNFVNVDDIFMENDSENLCNIFIIKDNEKKPLYVTA